MLRFRKLPTLVIIFYGLQLHHCTAGEEPTGSTTNCSQTVSHQGETASKCCVFPFVYLGEQHNSCIKTSDGAAWCSKTANYDIDGKKIDCPTTNPDDGGGGDSGEGQCHSFPSGISSLIGGTIAPDRRWNLQCHPSRAVTSLWDDVNRFTLLGDVKCCDAPVDQNISYVFNLSMRIGGGYDPKSRWKAQCPDNYVITGLHAQKAGLKKWKRFGNLDAVKCSLLLEHRLDYDSCTTVDLPDKTGGTRDSTATWRTECPSEHFISALYNDLKFTGVKKIKCCPARAVAISQKVCTFEDGVCGLWEFINPDRDGSWKLRNGAGLGTVDHTTGKATGHVIYMTSNISQLSTVGVKSSEQGRCLSLWYTMKGNSRIDLMALLYDENIDGLVERTLGDVETGENRKWMEKQAVLPRKHNYQLIIQGVSRGIPSEITLDDIQIKPERFCIGLCSSLGPLQGSSSIHDGPLTPWQASCRGVSSSSSSSSSTLTSIVTGLWDKQGSHFQTLEYLKCCNMPVNTYYKILLTGKEGGSASENERWNAQCKDNYVLTGIYSLNKFNGFYQLQCSSLYQSRVDYSNCVVIWAEERNHEGDPISQHIECPSGMVVIGLFDHQGDNNRTSFADIDAVKCCMVDTPDCVTQADCNINADCVTTNTVMKCSCKTGFYGNGKVCKSVVPPTSTTESPITKKQNATTDIPVNPSTPTTTYINPGVDTSGNGLGFSTSSSISNRRQQNSQSVILITVTVVGILVAVLLGVLVWRVRRAKKARLRVQGSNTAKPDQAEMTPFNDIKIINNDNPAQDQQVTSSHLAVVGEEDDSSRAPNNPHQNDNSK
ncbi:uncharacterized protein LOC116292923, partial [Actinia tenebrosa]|uniref:Uncharacterized protein LOC116292923 n=1 Tax=Actinia tenebrosa TaxID=6105 RepID=A0A6P8HJY4_ACTTE